MLLPQQFNRVNDVLLVKSKLDNLLREHSKKVKLTKSCIPVKLLILLAEMSKLVIPLTLLVSTFPSIAPISMPLLISALSKFTSGIKVFWAQQKKTENSVIRWCSFFMK
jgi:hypothetical protein